MLRLAKHFDHALLRVLWVSMLTSVVWMLCARIELNLWGILALVLFTRQLNGRFDLWLHLQ